MDELATRTAVLAGVSAAALRAGIEVDPARYALSARQAAADGPGGNRRRLLLVVDQFEQVFTRCSDESERRAFITALHAAATIRSGRDEIPPALVILVLRADFEARCSEYPKLTEAVKNRYLSYAKLTLAHLHGTNFTRADLSDANFTRAYLNRANFTRAALPSADFSFAYLSFADLTRADLPSADLTGADLTGANLTGTKGISTGGGSP